MATEGFEIRPLQAADVGAAVELARAQGFRDRTRFYEFVMRVPTCRPVVGIADGRLVATGLATANGRVGWLGGIAVEAGFRRRGFGRAVTEELIRLLELAGCETLSLEATEAGRPMYERMGFRLVSYYHELQAGHLAEEPVPPPGTRARPLQATDLAAICALDRQATGEDRSAPLTVLAESGGWVLEDEAAVLRRGERPGRLRRPAARLPPPDRTSLRRNSRSALSGRAVLLDLHRHVVPEGAHVGPGSRASTPLPSANSRDVAGRRPGGRRA